MASIASMLYDIFWYQNASQHSQLTQLDTLVAWNVFNCLELSGLETAQLWQHLAPDPVLGENKMTGRYLKHPLIFPKVGGLMPIAQLHQAVENWEYDHQ